MVKYLFNNAFIVLPFNSNKKFLISVVFILDNLSICPPLRNKVVRSSDKSL